jgi:hypothetical protein
MTGLHVWAHTCCDRLDPECICPCFRYPTDSLMIYVPMGFDATGWDSSPPWNSAFLVEYRVTRSLFATWSLIVLDQDPLGASPVDKWALW